MANGITKYMEKYFENKFNHLHEEIAEVKTEVKEIKVELKKNGKCINDCKDMLTNHKSRIKHLFIITTIIFVIVVVGFATGIDIFINGVLGFIK